MAVKLRSIAKSTPWFLISKALSVAVVWLLPHFFWLFVLLALYFYFFPSLYSFQLLLPFGITLGFSFLLPPTFFHALIIASLFFLMFGIKELIFVNRSRAERLLGIALAALILWQFFSFFRDWNGLLFGFASGLSVLLILLLLKRFFPPALLSGTGRPFSPLFALGLIGFLLWELLSALTFLPLSFPFRLALGFLGTAALTGGIILYLGQFLNRTRILLGLSFFFVAVTIILSAANWKL